MPITRAIAYAPARGLTTISRPARSDATPTTIGHQPALSRLAAKISSNPLTIAHTPTRTTRASAVICGHTSAATPAAMLITPMRIRATRRGTSTPRRAARASVTTPCTST